MVTSQLGERGWRLQAGPLSLKGLARTYADAAPGEFLALAGSHGFIEIACAMDNAAHRLQAGVGLAVSIRKAPSAKVKGARPWETTGDNRVRSAFPLPAPGSRAYGMAAAVSEGGQALQPMKFCL